ncbi:MAG TPA: DNA-processing protein DprA [Symbiobacteriaceae bacterium]|nr:DNA-processing protein DprA [Symbiobacteriaceae bacterium]
MDGALVWLILARAPGVGRIRLAKLMNAYPDPADAWRARSWDLMAVEGWSRQTAEALVAVRGSTEARREAEAEWENAKAAGLKLVAMSDADYPVRLRYTVDPPPYFYQAGPWLPDARPVIAIVGTRKPTSYGLAVAERFGRDLARLGAVVVSGMARGIDCAAHRGALEAGGSTVAVLGGGADVCYPREAGPIYRAIRDTGAVISEQPPGAEPRSEFFPERNRIISGLAHGIVVVEAGEKSGTLITVAQAISQGRDVFAVPGPITSPMSVGPHALLRDGAVLATSAEQILEELGFERKAMVLPAGRRPELDSEQERVLGWMGGEPRWAGDLAEVCGLPAGQVQGMLTMLELKGLVRQLPGGQYLRIG